MAGNSSIKGFDRLIKDLISLGNDLPEKIRGVALQNAKELAATAKSNAPVNDGLLRSSIRVDEESDRNTFYSFVVEANAGHAAYMEFGTGRKVQVPAELQSLASEIQNAPSGRSFEEGLNAIKDWAKKKGLSEDDAYPIFMSILRNGVTPHPFLYPALLRQRNIYYQDLENLLNNELKKID
ncbi:MAG TPA: HK97-gp10 family putative phage morphogenesis protein [Desulfosporosinus sp.]|nr:HK97-gp10 family putative phage morphogenesis protein [Desulfosporosinus sp.]